MGLGKEDAQVIRTGLASMQLCVPEGWTDEQAVTYANTENPSGTANGWQIRREGDEALAGMPERNPCAVVEGRVHIMLDC